MQLPLESVPNFSEGRNEATIDALGAALSGSARLLDVHADEDHNRSVFTLVADEAGLLDALVAGVACARELIDLRAHEGAHPRVGVADVVPIVPIRGGDMPRARAAALELGRRLGEAGTPVFLYGETGEQRRPAFFRRGGLEELRRRVAAGELAPDFGPNEINERSGASIVGARGPLIAFNVDLRGASVEDAREIAALVRERDGGFPGVRALGLELPRAGCVQVSMNVEDWEAAALHEIVARIAFEAARRGADVYGSELVGLMPAGAAAAAAGHVLGIDGFDTRHVLELRLLDDEAGRSGSQG
ncbi:MAG: glutamate formimidoyltransferase [Actinomycetota bacterium]|nr:glutamate formimidoyltransferase [Actinomycetota bacterium]